jgi:hypothetical protein
MSRRGLPVALLALALLLDLAFQTVQQVRQSQFLATIDRNQDGPLQEAAKLRQATDSLVADILKLAQSGNAAAKQVVDDMAKQNIVLRVTSAAGAAPGATAPVPAAPETAH